MNGSPYAYTVEGEKLTRVQIVERVLLIMPALKPDTIRKRIDDGVRTWDGLAADPARGVKSRRDTGKARLSRVFGRPQR